MKADTIKRLTVAEQKAPDIADKNIRKVIEKMTTDELRECLDDNTTEERFQEIWKAAARR